jgi:two-component system, LytTR family, sensor kinase
MDRKISFFDLRQDRYRIWLHVIFWMAYVFYEGVVWGRVDGDYSRRLVCSLIDLPVKLGAAYYTLYILIDRFFIQRRYAGFLFLLLLSMTVFGIISRVVGYYVLYPLYYPEAMSVGVFFTPKILITIFSIYSVVGILASFHLVRQWYRHEQATRALEDARQQLQKEMLEAELKLLKSQINPHFLFNTLNNLYVLSLQQSDKTPEIVYKLSNLMSYMLYEGNHAEVPLEREIHYIRNYIALEQIRYDARLEVAFNIYDDVGHLKVAPLVLLPFVENGFKHGVSHQLTGAWIRIDIGFQEGVLIIKVENSKPPENERPYRSNLHSGFGLDNLKKRLDLMYPGRYHLDVLDEEDSYLVVLRLTLEENAYTEMNPSPEAYEMSYRG